MPDDDYKSRFTQRYGPISPSVSLVPAIPNSYRDRLSKTVRRGCGKWTAAAFNTLVFIRRRRRRLWSAPTDTIVSTAVQRRRQTEFYRFLGVRITYYLYRYDTECRRRPFILLLYMGILCVTRTNNIEKYKYKNYIYIYFFTHTSDRYVMRV